MRSRRQDDIFESICRLEAKREVWVTRDVLALDFSHVDNAWLERSTFDVDVEEVRRIWNRGEIYRPGVLQSNCDDNFLYLPLYWREKDSFLELDCLSSDGTSLNLATRAFTMKLAEYAFWRASKLVGFSKNEFTDCIHAYVHSVIGMEEEDCGLKKFCTDKQCNNHEYHRGRLQQLLSIPELARMWQNLLHHRLMVIKIPSESNFSVVKVQETFALQSSWFVTRSWKSKLADFNPFIPEVKILLPSRAAAVTKLIMPRDVKLLKSVTFDSWGIYKGKVIPREMIVHGDGSWGSSYNRDIDPDSAVDWTMVAVPHSSHLLMPGLAVSLFALAATLAWIFAGLPEELSESIPALAYIALIPVLFDILMRRDRGSLIYEETTRKYRWCMWLEGVLLVLSLILGKAVQNAGLVLAVNWASLFIILVITSSFIVSHIKAR